MTRPPDAPASLCVVLTSPMVLNAFLLGHLAALADRYRVTVCVNTLESPVSPRLDARIELLHLPIARPIDPLRDLRALAWLLCLFRARHFDGVHSLTPKGGLLAMLAARLCRVPLRTHIFTGQVWATRRGLARALLRNLDRLMAACATDLLADSASQARFLEAERVCPPGRVRVFGAGSISGVDLARFAPEPGRRERVRAALGVPVAAPLFLFLGRLQRDKGVPVLADAFARLAARHAAPHLLLVGRDEEGLADAVRASVPGRCHLLGLTPRPEDYLDAADVLVLPSFREGFGTVVIEAAAMGRPAIASRIYGLTDAVDDGNTGLLCPPGDVAQLEQALEHMLEPGCIARLGARAQARARAQFDAHSVTGYWLDFYRERLGEGARGASA